MLPAQSDDLFERSLFLLRMLVYAWPRKLPEFTRSQFDLPVSIATAWDAALRSRSEEDAFRYGLIPFSIYKLEAGSMGVGQELSAVLSCGHVSSSATLTRSIFESLVAICYVLADENRMTEHALGVYRLSHEERAWILERALEHNGSMFAPIIAKNCRQIAEADQDGFNRIHWNQQYEDSDNAKFLALRGLEKFTEGLRSILAEPKEIARSFKGLKPWTREQKVWRMCKAIDKCAEKRGKKYLLLPGTSSYQEEYDLIYPMFCQLVHLQVAGRKAFAPKGEDELFLTVPDLDKAGLEILAYKALEYLSQVIKVVCAFTKTPPDGDVKEVFEGVEDLRQRLPEFLQW